MPLDKIDSLKRLFNRIKVPLQTTINSTQVEISPRQLHPRNPFISLLQIQRRFKVLERGIGLTLLLVVAAKVVEGEREQLEFCTAG